VALLAESLTGFYMLVFGVSRPLLGLLMALMCKTTTDTTKALKRANKRILEGVYFSRVHKLTKQSPFSSLCGSFPGLLSVVIWFYIAGAESGQNRHNKTG